LISLDSLRIIALLGVHLESMRSLQGLTRSPQGVQQELTRSPWGVHKDLPGVHEESTRSPAGVDKESMRSPQGLTRSPQGVYKDSIRSWHGVLKESLRSPQGLTRSPRGPVGECKLQPFGITAFVAESLCMLTKTHKPQTHNSSPLWVPPTLQNPNKCTNTTEYWMTP
jgi:hypothetical protein